MLEPTLAAIKAAIMAAIMNTFGLYTGAGLIAIVAALARVSYSPEVPTLNLFGRFFAMSLSLTMLMVHIGKQQEWNAQMVIIISGVSAFLCREVLDVVMISKDSIVKKILTRFKE